MPTKGNLGQDPNSQESARSSQSYISNLVVIPVEEGINPVQLNTDPTPQPEDFFILTKPDGTSYKSTLESIAGQNNGATSLAVESENNTIQQVGSSLFDPVLRRLTVNLAGIPQVQSDWTQASSSAVDYIKNKPPAATQQQVLSADPLANKEAVTPSLMNFQQQGTGAVLYPLVSKMQQTVSVKDFGAIGDGVADDTAAIQAAINSLVSGEVNFVSTKKYKITASLIIQSGITINGHKAKLINALASPDFMIKSATSINNIEVHDIVFDGKGMWTSTPFPNPYAAGDSVGFTNSNGAILVWGSDIKIYNNSVSGVMYGIWINSFNFALSTKIAVYNNFIENVGQHGIRLDYSSSAFINNNSIKQISGNMTAAGDVNIDDSKFADGIYLGSVQNAIITQNTIDDIIRIGIVVDNPQGGGITSLKSSNLEIDNNVITYFHGHRGGESNYAVWVEPYASDGTMTISNNSISNPALIGDTKVGGIYLYWGGLINGNMIKNCWTGSRGDTYDFTNNILENVGMGSYLTDFTPNPNMTTRPSIITGNLYDNVGAALGVIVSGTPPLERYLDFSNNIINVSNANSLLVAQPIIYIATNDCYNVCKVTNNIINNDSLKTSVYLVAGVTAGYQGVGDYIIRNNTINNKQLAEAVQVNEVNEENQVSAAAFASVSPTGYNLTFADNSCSGSITVVEFTSTLLNKYSINITSNNISMGYVGIYIKPARSNQVGNCNVVIKGNIIEDSATTGIKIEQNTIGNINGIVNIVDNTIVNCGISAVNEYDKSAMLLYHATLPAICTYSINNNVLVTNAGADDDVGQLYGICQLSVGTSAASSAFIKNNSFVFTGQLNTYPANLNVKPCSLSVTTGSPTDIPALYDVVHFNNNLNSKLPNRIGVAGMLAYTDGVGQTNYGFTATAPSGSNYKVGDYYLQPYPISSGFMGWVFTSSGWKTFGAISS